MGDWAQKSDADTSKNMSDRPAGSASEPCPTERKLESVFVPPESVTVAAKIQVAEVPAVNTKHSTEADHSIQTSHTSEPAKS
jgi:hypothetical protein